MTAPSWVFRKHWHPERRWYARLRALLLILRGHETEICGRCGGAVGLVWRAPDPVWWMFSGFPGDAGVLCLPCFSARAERLGVSLYWECSTPHTWPACSGQPCAHEETTKIVVEQRDRYWGELQEARKEEEE